ncbi:hypothetical protein GCM10011585_18320 [Edaphobacter dinghuensis]|uniref:Outer membrane lipoprotein-sorting protein n=1 Tax=Edaphobacter dinghuensis TaxID=1560005 RepID=A0A917M3Y3_9BACT|nr:hypothetical protein GCM10011585_18320 [Edaphobacter dinghuensis]
MYLIIGCTLASAQSSSPAVFDKDVPIPTITEPFGQWDATALNEIVDHLKVVGTSPWSGLQGTGQITYGVEDTTAYSATLSILDGTGFRLDGQTAKGELSIRINGGRGKIQEGDGHLYPLLPNTAKSGIVQFELPRLANFPYSGTSLLDRGLVVIDGRSLHRITYETTTADASEVVRKKNAVITDFYFDPTSHLLIKSANSIRIDGAGNADFLRVISYDDYRSVQGSMVPFRFTQTLNGQKQWTLQLSTVQLNPALETSSFEF